MITSVLNYLENTANKYPQKIALDAGGLPVTHLR